MMKNQREKQMSYKNDFYKEEERKRDELFDAFGKHVEDHPIGGMMLIPLDESSPEKEYWHQFEPYSLYCNRDKKLVGLEECRKCSEYIRTARNGIFCRK